MGNIFKLLVPKKFQSGCPNCGQKTGYYIKSIVKAKRYMRYSKEGEYLEDWPQGIDTDSINSITEIRQHKWAYCIECNKRIFKL